MSDPTEVILDAFIDLNNNGVEELEDYAEGALAALRAEGFELYRPEDCERIEAFNEFITDQTSYAVPVSEGTEQ